MLEGAQKICPEPIFMKLDTQMAKITVNKEKPIFAKRNMTNAPKICKNEKFKNRATSCFKLGQKGS